MSSICQSKRNGLFVCWLLLLLFIPVLSVKGRTLQRWTIANLGYNVTAWLIFISLATALGLLLRMIYKRDRNLPVVHLLWVLPLFLGAPFLLGRVEERLHFLVFGAFGALSMFMYQPKAAFALCFSVAAGDELLQHFLPDRVGDWRDVALNSVASLAAALFVWMNFVRPGKQTPDD